MAVNFVLFKLFKVLICSVTGLVPNVLFLKYVQRVVLNDLDCVTAARPKFVQTVGITTLSVSFKMCLQTVIHYSLIFYLCICPLRLCAKLNLCCSLNLYPKW